MESGSSETVRILIFDASQEEANTCLNAFREAGYSTRANLINDFKELTSAVTAFPPWDLLLLVNKPESRHTSQVCELIGQQHIDLPVITLLTPDDDTDSISLIKQGVSAVLPLGDDDYLSTIGGRQFEALKARRHHRRMSVALYESEKHRRMLLDDQVDPVVYISSGNVQYANSAFLTMLGMPAEKDITNKPFKEFVSDKDQKEVEEFLFNIEESGQAMAAIQCSLSGINGEEVTTRAVISATSYNERFTLSLQVHADTEEEGIKDIPNQVFQSSEKLQFDRDHFEQFQQLVDVAAQKAVAGKGKSALCCVHIDTLKEINANHGRESGQNFVAAITGKITAFLGEAHPFSSLGGGSYIVLLREGDEEKVRRMMNDLLITVSSGQISVDGKAMATRLSIGSVLISETSCDTKSLVSQCRQAAVLANRQGGNQVCIYQKKRTIQPVRSVEKHLAGMVSQALKSKKLKLNYQPVISMSGSSAEYYEVTLNIADEQGREHSASVFRPKLEKISLWKKVDQWQLIEASKALKTKRKEGRDTRLMIQMGGYAVFDAQFLPWMRVALKAAGIPTSAVAVELSELTIARFSEKISGFFKELKNMGCQTVIREFGCSVNPLAAIQNLDVDLVMLDPSFTDDLGEQAKQEELRKMIEGLNNIGKQVIISGIASAEEMAPAWHFGANFIEGDFLHPPCEHMNFNFDG